jgi:hypothetical protein
MTEMDMLHSDQGYDNTDIFIVADDNNIHDFVSIDDTFIDLSDVVMIDISNDEFHDAITIDINHDTDFFVSLDHDVILSDFTIEDFNSTIIDFDAIHDIDAHNV